MPTPVDINGTDDNSGMATAARLNETFADPTVFSAEIVRSTGGFKWRLWFDNPAGATTARRGAAPKKPGETL